MGNTTGRGIGDAWSPDPAGRGEEDGMQVPGLWRGVDQGGLRIGLRSWPIGLADISRGRPQGYLHLIPPQELIAPSRGYGLE